MSECWLPASSITLRRSVKGKFVLLPGIAIIRDTHKHTRKMWKLCIVEKAKHNFFELLWQPLALLQWLAIKMRNEYCYVAVECNPTASKKCFSLSQGSILHARTVRECLPYKKLSNILIERMVLYPTSSSL